MLSLPEVSDDDIQRAADILRAGGLVAFPTETVYGLGADADNSEAVARVFQAKGRPASHPLIVHIRGVDQLSEWAIDISETAWALARAFWPGPLTLVLKRAARVGDAVTGGQDTVALRSPAHPVARRLLEAFKGGIAAPSANKFGHISPTLAEHVREDLGSEVGLVLDGGPTEIGIESTIVDMSRGDPVILRPGQIGAEQIAKVVGSSDDATESVPEASSSVPRAPGSSAPRAPGSHESHYAPRAAMKLVKRREFTDELVKHRGQRVAVLALEISVPRIAASVTRVLPASAALYARELYAKLRELDALGADLILVEAPPKTASWTAIWDRLSRAAHPHAIGPRAERHSHPWKGEGKRGAAAPAQETVESTGEPTGGEGAAGDPSAAASDGAGDGGRGDSGTPGQA
jgi:L-threonylcarbamoyladenylate synthase